MLYACDQSSLKSQKQKPLKSGQKKENNVEIALLVACSENDAETRSRNGPSYIPINSFDHTTRMLGSKQSSVSNNGPPCPKVNHGKLL